MRFFLLFFLLWAAVAGYAVELDDLYQANVALTRTDRTGRLQAMQRALQQVLVKVSGNPAIAEDKKLLPGIGKVSDFVVQFSIENDQGLRRLQARFDEAKVNRLIWQGGYRLWGKNRPKTLVWLVHEDTNGQRRLLSDGDENALVRAMSDVASGRGLPIQLPLGDIDDFSRLHLLDIWGRFAGPVVAASQRYRPEAVLMARLFPYHAALATEQDYDEHPAADEQKPSAWQWQLDWYLVQQDWSRQGTMQGNEAAALAARLLRDVANAFAERYAIDASGKQQHYVLTLTNMDSLTTLVAVENYLAALTEVSAVALEEINGSKAVFRLTLLGGQDIRRLLALDDKLHYMPPPPGTAPPLHDQYRWSGQQP